MGAPAGVDQLLHSARRHRRAADAARTSRIGTSTVFAETSPSFHASNDSRTFAVPSPASFGASTRPSRQFPQQRSFSVYFRLIGSPPFSLPGKLISATG